LRNRPLRAKLLPIKGRMVCFDMLESLITSKTRIKLLLKFFLNPETHAYLRELANEFGESSNGIRVELNRLTDAKLLKSENEGRTVVYHANTDHSFFKDLQHVVRKYVGIDHLIEDLVNKLGNIEAAYITGDYARGVDSGTIDLVLIGHVNQSALDEAVKKTGKLIHRKIHPVVFATSQSFRNLNIEDVLLIWSDNQTPE